MPWLNVAALKSSQAPGAFVTELFDEPAGTLARTMPRDRVSASGNGPNSGTVYLRQIILPQGLTFNTVMMMTGSTAKTGGTHGWYVVTDNTLKVLATTADQTDAATVWGTTNTVYPLQLTSTVTTSYTGQFYVGAMVAQSAGTNPNWGSSANMLGTSLASLAPVFGGPSSTAQTTPPANGTVLTAITASGGFNFYAALSMT